MSGTLRHGGCELSRRQTMSEGRHQDVRGFLLAPLIGPGPPPAMPWSMGGYSGQVSRLQPDGSGPVPSPAWLLWSLAEAWLLSDGLRGLTSCHYLLVGGTQQLEEVPDPLPNSHLF